MLDAITKRKIDSARQILVGKVPDPKAQVDQITTALIYKFMDDMDKESEELGGEAKFFAGEFAQYAWTKLLDNKLSGQERLDLYVQAITNMPKNPHIPQLFRDIFKGAFLPYNDPRTLSLFLKEINEFSYEHSENLGNAFEYLLSVLGSQGDAGQFRTPRHIIDFIVEVVDPKKNETILDPACGTAGFLISAYKHILKTNKEKPLTPDEKLKLMNNLAGYDISPDMVKLALVNMYLHGFPEPKIHEYDTLSSEKRWDETFDVILANPPFMTPKGGITPHKRFSIQAKRAEVLFVDYIVEHLTIKGRAGIIVPEGIIFQSNKAYVQLRKKLVEDGLFAVVSLPSGVFQPYSGVKTSILLFDKELAKRTKNILFVKIQNDGFDLGAQRREIDKNDLPLALNIIKKFKSTLSDTEFSEDDKQLAHVVAKEKIIESGDYNLSGERYKEVVSFAHQKWPMVELKDYVFLQEGPGIRSYEYDYSENGYPIINVRCVQDGYIDLSGCKRVKPELANGQWNHFKVQEGDILFTTSGTIGRVAIVNAKNLPLLMNTSVVRFRTLDEEKLNNRFLYQILKSQKFVEELKTKATGIAQVNVGPSHLKEMLIPLPPLEVQKEIVEQIEVKQKAIDHAKAVIESLEKERRYFGQALKNLEGVEWVELGEVVEIQRGGSPRPIDDYITTDNDGINWIKIGDVREGDKFITQTKEKIRKEGLSKTRLVKNGDLILSNSMSFGRPYIVKIDGAIHDGWLQIRIKDKEQITPDFLCQILKTDFLKNQYEKVATGGVVKNLNSNLVKNLKIPLPPLEIQKQLVAEAEKEEEIITANRRLIEIMERKIEEVLSNI
jgi:type I restriction enzyme M protein